LGEAEYWIIGDGPDRRRLEEMAKSLGIGERVRFLGSLPRYETLALLSECSALVHPSLHDSGGWVCIEAMAAARPVICLNLGGPAIMVDTETGIKVDASNAEEAVEGLASGMSALAGRPAWLRALGETGRQRAREHFTWEAKAVEIINAYEFALKQPRS
jgi:glycosyltransferase involved in cell wall biosynthesis